MQFLTLDSIVRNVLLKEGKSSHYYLQYLAYAVSALQKLNTTTLRNINSVKLPVTSYEAIPLPVDYVDWVLVGYQFGERVRPLIQDERMNRLNNFNSSGQKVIYPSQTPDGVDISVTSAGNIGDYGPLYADNINGIYNGAFDANPQWRFRDMWKFKVLPERNEIQLSAAYPYDFIILDYISDGRSADAATKVNPLAIETIEKYILWQYKLHSRSYSPGERQEAERLFKDEWRLLRASIFGLSKDDIVHAIKSRYLPYAQEQATDNTGATPILPVIVTPSGTFATEGGIDFVSEDGTTGFKTQN